MQLKGRMVLSAIVAGLLLTISGCPGAGGDSTSNQGGGSVFTTGAKFANDNIGDLNPDEWQIAFDYAPMVADWTGIDLSEVGEIPALSDEEAQSIVDLLDEHNVSTMAEAGQLVEQIAMGNVQVPANLMALYEDFMASEEAEEEGEEEPAA
jgi:hypothetical protein